MNNDKPSTQASPYLAYYGMTREPFAPIIDDDLFYPEPTRKQRLEILLHLTQYGNEVMQVSGPQGSGKTTLLRQFRQQAPDNWQLACIEAEGGLDERQFLQQLFHQLKLDFQAASRNDLHEKLQHHFESLQRSARQAVILVDNAEQLHIITLKNILALAAHMNADNNPVLRVLFFGTSEMGALFSDPHLGPLKNLPQRTIDLTPFDNEQTTHYVLHRLSAANFSASKPFSDAVLSKIHKQSQGWPGRINQLAHEVLMSSLPARPDKTGSRLPVSRPLRSIAMTIIIAAIIAILVFQDDINIWLESEEQDKDAPLSVTEKLPLPDIKSKKPTASSATDSAPLSITTPEVGLPPASLSETPIMKTETEPHVSEGGVSQTDADPLNTVMPEILPDPEQPPAPASVTNPVETLQGKEITKSEEVTPIHETEIVVGSLKPSSSTAPDSPDTKPVATDLPVTETPTPKTSRSEVAATALKNAQLIAPVTQTDSEPTASPLPQDTTITAPAQTPILAPAPKTPRIKMPPAYSQIKMPLAFPNQDLPSRQNDWLMTQDPTHFTLQIVAGNNVETIRYFIREHRLKDNLALYQTTRQGKPWFGLVQGTYPDKQAAIDARSRLPEHLRRLEPWVRDLGGIQNTLPKSTN